MISPVTFRVRLLRRLTFFAVCIGLLAPIVAHAWGWEAHRRIHAAALKALDIIESMPAIGKKLLNLAAGFRNRIESAGYSTFPSESQIVPVMTGENRKAVAFSEYLEKQDISAVAVRPPTVPSGTARLRFSVTLSHSKDDLLHTAEVIGRFGGSRQ